MVMIWGFRDRGNRANATDAEKRRRTLVLLNELSEKKATIIVPTIIVAELLIPLPAEEHGNFLGQLEKYFFCPPFDLRACGLAAELWIKHRSQPEGDRINRVTLKADVMIIATAKSAGATVFYSHDKKCRKLAEQAGLTAKDLPTHSEDLLVEEETRRGEIPELKEKPKK